MSSEEMNVDTVERNENNGNVSSDDENSSNKKCKHVKEKEMVKVKRLEKTLQHHKSASELNCQTCAKNNDNPSSSADQMLNDITSIDDSSKQDIFICLSCGETNCGRRDKGHAIKHYEEKNHSLSINLESTEVWCYDCDFAVEGSTNKNQILVQAQAYIKKQFKEKFEFNDDERDNNSYTRSRKRLFIEVTAPGLTNLGNTCFFNSVMQVVVGTTVLHDTLIIPSDRYNDPPHIDVTRCIAATQNDVGPLTNAFKNFLIEMWRTREDVIAPKDLFNQISKKWQQFRGWRQQDSQELMRFLFDGVKSEELELIRKLQPQPQKPQDDDTDEDDDDFPNNEGNGKHVSFIDACFGGRLVSVIVCDVCKNCSYSYEEFLDVSLPIKSSADDHYKSKNSFGMEYGYGSFIGISDSSNKNNEGSSSQTHSDDGSDADNTGNHGEEASSDTEIEEGIPVPNKEERNRIKLLLRDLPSDSGRSTPNKEHVTLRDCLKGFVKVETLEKDNSFACNNCWKLKEEYDEKMEQMETKENTSTDNDSDDDTDQSENSQNNGNGVNSENSEENMDMDVDYNAKTGNPSNVNVTEGSSSFTTNNSVMDNDNSSDANDNRHNMSFDDNNDFLNTTSSLTAKRPKQSSQSERKYILRKAYKRYLFSSLPPVLVFHLKRFQQVTSRWSNTMRKIDDFVAFDEELDVSDFVVPPEIEKEENGINNGHIIDNETKSSTKQNTQHTKYRLYGVVVHLGSLYNGHYVAYVLSRNIRGEGEQFGLPRLSYDTITQVTKIEQQQKLKTNNQRQWIYCSDSSVRAVTVEEVLNNNGAYLLFYERVYE